MGSENRGVGAQEGGECTGAGSRWGAGLLLHTFIGAWVQA